MGTQYLMGKAVISGEVSAQYSMGKAVISEVKCCPPIGTNYCESSSKPLAKELTGI